MTERCDVVVVGGGPAGLSVASQLQKSGAGKIVVLERESEAGGVPRHCGHWGFGWESHRTLLNGPAYAARLRQEASGIDLRLQTTVLEFRTPHVMRIQTRKGISEIEAREIVMATGARESTRAQRLLGGNRTAGIVSTGMLQQMVYLKGMKPFSHPVIIGSEWVSFSALMTCHHAGIKPVCMLEEEKSMQAPMLFRWGARWRYGVPLRTSTKVLAIRGGSSVEAVEVERNGRKDVLACDGVIVSGRFRPEDALFASGPLAKPHAHVHFIGNVAGKLKTAGRCVAEARQTAKRIRERMS